MQFEGHGIQPTFKSLTKVESTLRATSPSTRVAGINRQCTIEVVRVYTDNELTLADRYQADRTVPLWRTVGPLV